MWGPRARINQKFMTNLANAFGQKEFTAKEAQWLYVLKHAQGPFHEGQDFYWPKANARAYIAIAAERGILIRVRKGVYKFNK